MGVVEVLNTSETRPRLGGGRANERCAETMRRSRYGKDGGLHSSWWNASQSCFDVQEKDLGNLPSC